MARTNSMKGRAGKSPAATLAGFVFIWILIPVALYFLGYKLIGPEFGKIPVINSQVHKVENLITGQARTTKPKPVQQSENDDDQVAAQSDINGPDIEVEVAPASGRRHSSRNSESESAPKPRKKKKSSKPAATVTQPRDEASGDAAMGGAGNDGPSDPASGGGQ